jgi:hypothetical protein
MVTIPADSDGRARDSLPGGKMFCGWSILGPVNLGHPRLNRRPQKFEPYCSLDGDRRGVEQPAAAIAI